MGNLQRKPFFATDNVFTRERFLPKFQPTKFLNIFNFFKSRFLAFLSLNQLKQPKPKRRWQVRNKKAGLLTGPKPAERHGLRCVTYNLTSLVPVTHAPPWL